MPLRSQWHVLWRFAPAHPSSRACQNEICGYPLRSAPAVPPRAASYPHPDSGKKKNRGLRPLFSPQTPASCAPQDPCKVPQYQCRSPSALFQAAVRRYPLRPCPKTQSYVPASAALPAHCRVLRPDSPHTWGSPVHCCRFP